MIRRVIRRGVHTLGVAALLLVIAVLALQAWYAAWVLYYAEHDPYTTAFMQRRAEQADSRPALRHHWVAYERVSPWLKRAVVAAEDARFLRHNGFDWSALEQAMRENLASGEIVRGGSTITQQLAKNLFLSPHQSYLRKLQEAAIAVMLEAFLDKRRILELYLNLIEWGDGIFGAAAAAQHYYGIEPAALTRRQAAELAARIPAPRFYDRNGITPTTSRAGLARYGCPETGDRGRPSPAQRREADPRVTA